MSYTATLVLGARRYPLELSQDELQKYSDSLLAQLAASGADGVVNLNNIPNNPLRDLSDPSAAIKSLYRNGMFDEKTANHLVASRQESCNSAYSKAKNLLNYLGLPGPVTAWLPDIQQLTLRSGRIARLVYRAIAIETVDGILSFQPFEGPKPWAASNPALFLIQKPQINSKGQLQVPKVYTLESSYQKFLEWLVSARSIRDFWDGRTVYSSNDVVRVYSADPCKMIQSPEASADLEDVVGEHCGKVMEAGDSDLKSVIKEELQSACKQVGLGAMCLGVRWADIPGDERVPVWCIKW